MSDDQFWRMAWKLATVRDGLVSKRCWVMPGSVEGDLMMGKKKSGTSALEG
jgi:hypothetical protein